MFLTELNASGQLLELWQLTRKTEVDNALAQPAGQAAAKQSKDANAFRRFATGEGWSDDDHKELVANMQRIKREFPAVVSNRGNSDAIAGWLLDNKRYPTYADMLLAATTLACEGKLLLNPSAVGIPEDRYGEHRRRVPDQSRQCRRPEAHDDAVLCSCGGR